MSKARSVMTAVEKSISRNKRQESLAEFIFRPSKLFKFYELHSRLDFLLTSSPLSYPFTVKQLLSDGFFQEIDATISSDVPVHHRLLLGQKR